MQTFVYQKFKQAAEFLSAMRRILSFLILINGTSLVAQDSNLTSYKKCWMCGTGLHASATPYSLTLKNEIPYIAIGLSISSIALTMDMYNPVQPYTANELLSLDKNRINSFDRSATDNWSPSANGISNVLISTATLLPIIFITNRHTKSYLFPLIVMYGEVLLANYGVTMFTKNVVNRARPLTYNTEAPMEKRTNSTSKESFFSGHTSHATASSIFVAKVLCDYHPNMNKGLKIGIWTAMLTLPAVTAYLRVQAGKHFPTDVIVGYVVGGAIGYFIPHLHKLNARSTPKISLIPIFGIDHTSLMMRVKL